MKTRILLSAFLLSTLGPALRGQGSEPRFLAPVAWEAFEGDWSDLPDFEGLEPVSSGEIETPGLGVRPREDRYALRFRGRLAVPRRGLYRFHTVSDDGSRLFVAGRLAVDNGGTHGARRVDGELLLDAGEHPFELLYHEAGGAESLALGVEGPLAIVGGATAPPAEPLSLWYRSPARSWIEALPLGNGRLGAMIQGEVFRESIQLNEDSVWGGRPDDRFDRGSPEELARVRALLFRGRHAEVEAGIMDAFTFGGLTARSHQTLGTLRLDHALEGDEVEEYRRELDLRRGVARTSFRAAGVEHVREAWCSAPDDVLVIHLRASEPGRVAFRLRADRPLDLGHRTAETRALPGVGERPPRLRLEGRATNRKETRLDNGLHGVAFAFEVEVETRGGKVVVEDSGALRVENADEAVLVLAAETDWPGREGRIAAWRTRRGGALLDDEGRFARLRRRHVEDHRALMERCELELGEPGASAPTAERLESFRAGAEDPGLAALLFQYGRYLLVGCSRPGSLPANLQGLWNEAIDAPWCADYHLNINLQMNYWLAEPTGLSELHRPLFDWTESLARRGARRAEESFGCRGWVAPHASDAWAPAWTRSTRPYWGFWHMGGAWLACHLIEHWRFGGDETFARERGWPLVKGACLFLFDWLVEDPETGALVSGPSTSPENSFRLPEGGTASVCMGPAGDQQIAADLLDGALELAEGLGLEAAEKDFLTELRSVRRRLRSGLVVGEDGRLLEWDRPREEVEPGHRHMSHLYALHPDDAVDPVADPALAKAARAVLDARLRHGGAGTGWSRAWLVNLMARLHDGPGVEEHLREFLRRSVAINLFDLHPPFQIDGNFGIAAGIAEALLQSARGEIELLPALPPSWTEGRAKGLRARGGHAIDLAWSGGRLARAAIRAGRSGPLLLRCRTPLRVLDGSGRACALRPGPRDTIVWDAVAGRDYVVLPGP